jgi:Cof subfamily protein (haloacid dehalogenase superfamily)
MLTKDKLKDIKLVVFDLDGTLLNDDGAVGSSSLELIKELKKKNIGFSIASKRVPTSVWNYAEMLGLDEPLVLLNGALIQNYPEKQIFYQSFLPAKIVKKCVDYADKFLLKIALCHAEAIYYSEYNQAIPDLLSNYGSVYCEVDTYDNFIDETFEIIFVSEQKDTIKYVDHRLNFPYRFGLETSYFRSGPHQAFYFLEVRKSGSSKGTGLLKLVKYLNVKINETAVIGDWYNDRTMFETKAIKIAVANAVPEIKNMADYITSKTNNEDAVAEFLEMLLNAKKV